MRKQAHRANNLRFPIGLAVIGIEDEGWSLPQAAQITGYTSTRMVAEKVLLLLPAAELANRQGMV